MGGVEAEDIILFSKILGTTEDPNVKLKVLDAFLSLTGSKEGLESLYKSAHNIFSSLNNCTFSKNAMVAKKAATTLVNISAEKPGVDILLTMKFSDVIILIKNDLCKTNERDGIVSTCLEHIMDVQSAVTHEAGMILANLSRHEDHVQKLCDTFEDSKVVVEKLSDYALITDVRYDYLLFLLANLSQLLEIRKIFINSNRFLLQRLFPFVDYQKSTVRKNAVVSLIRNLCLSVENHEQLLDPHIDLLPRLLLPLAGSEEFDDEDNEKLPLDLQYLPSDKEREPNSNIRRMLLEILMQLCATKSGREIMRQYNVYIILRELHKWEKDVRCMATLEDLVNILIRTEEEIGADNLKEVVVPSNLIEKFSKMDSDMVS